MSKPNILLIMIDQHRFDRLSCMGVPVFQTSDTAICGKLHYVSREQPSGFDDKPMGDTPYASYANADKYPQWIQSSRSQHAPVRLRSARGRASRLNNEAAFKTDNWRTL
jgi:hypothetical protein